MPSHFAPYVPPISSYSKPPRPVPKPPIHNPYDKFSKPQFDAFIDDITGALRKALGRHNYDDSPSSKEYDDREYDSISQANGTRNGEQHVESLSELEEDSVADVMARRKVKGKARDPAERPGAYDGVGAQDQPIEIGDEDEDESEENEGEYEYEYDEEEEEGEGEGEYEEDGHYEEYGSDVEEYEEGASGPTKISHSRQYEHDDLDSDGSQGDPPDIDDGKVYDPSHHTLQYHGINGARKISQAQEEDDIIELLSDDPEPDEEEEEEAEDQSIEDHYEDGEDTLLPATTSSNDVSNLELFGDDSLGDEYLDQAEGDSEGEAGDDGAEGDDEQEHDEQSISLGDNGMDQEDLTRSSPSRQLYDAEEENNDTALRNDREIDPQPEVDEDTFPPRNYSPTLNQPLILADHWLGPKMYAEDFYAGGDFPEGTLDATTSSADMLTQYDGVSTPLEFSILSTDDDASKPPVIDVGAVNHGETVLLEDMFDLDSEKGENFRNGSLPWSSPPQNDRNNVNLLQAPPITDDNFDALYQDMEFDLSTDVKAALDDGAHNSIEKINWNHPPAFPEGRLTTASGHLATPDEAIYDVDAIHYVDVPFQVSHPSSGDEDDEHAVQEGHLGSRTNAKEDSSDVEAEYTPLGTSDLDIDVYHRKSGIKWEVEEAEDFDKEEEEEVESDEEAAQVAADALKMAAATLDDPPEDIDGDFSISIQGTEDFGLYNHPEIQRPHSIQSTEVDIEQTQSTRSLSGEPTALLDDFGLLPASDSDMRTPSLADQEMAANTMRELIDDNEEDDNRTPRMPNIVLGDPDQDGKDSFLHFTPQDETSIVDDLEAPVTFNMEMDVEDTSSPINKNDPESVLNGPAAIEGSPDLSIKSLNNVSGPLVQPMFAPRNENDVGNDVLSLPQVSPPISADPNAHDPTDIQRPTPLPRALISSYSGLFTPGEGSVANSPAFFGDAMMEGSSPAISSPLGEQEETQEESASISTELTSPELAQKDPVEVAAPEFPPDIQLGSPSPGTVDGAPPYAVQIEGRSLSPVWSMLPTPSLPDDFQSPTIDPETLKSGESSSAAPLPNLVQGQSDRQSPLPIPDPALHFEASCPENDSTLIDENYTGIAHSDNRGSGPVVLLSDSAVDEAGGDEDQGLTAFGQVDQREVDNDMFSTSAAQDETYDILDQCAHEDRGPSLDEDVTPAVETLQQSPGDDKHDERAPDLQEDALKTISSLSIKQKGMFSEEVLAETDPFKLMGDNSTVAPGEVEESSGGSSSEDDDDDDGGVDEDSATQGRSPEMLPAIQHEKDEDGLLEADHSNPGVAAEIKKLESSAPDLSEPLDDNKPLAHEVPPQLETEQTRATPQEILTPDIPVITSSAETLSRDVESNVESNVSNKPSAKRKRKSASSKPLLARTMSLRTGSTLETQQSNFEEFSGMSKDKAKQTDASSVSSKDSASSSSGASVASRMLHPSSRASSIASMAPSNDSIPSPTLDKPPITFTPLPTAYPSELMHRHGRPAMNRHNSHVPTLVVPPKPKLQINPSQRRIDQVDSTVTSPKAGPSQSPARSAISDTPTNSQTLPSPAVSNPRTTRNSSRLVTRSNCRFRRISVPREEYGPLINFLVPGCSLGNIEKLREEHITDLGEATIEDSHRMIKDVESLDFPPELFGVLHQLVGVDLLRGELQVFYLPQPGEEIQRKPPTPKKISIGRRHTRDSFGHGSPTSYSGPSRPPLDRMFSPLSPQRRPPLSAADSTTTSASRKAGQDYDQFSSSSISEEESSDDYIESSKPKKPKRSKVDNGDVVLPASVASKTIVVGQNSKNKKPKRLGSDAAAYRPEDDDGGGYSDDKESSVSVKNKKKGGNIRGLKRNRTFADADDRDVDDGNGKNSKKKRVEESISVGVPSNNAE